MKNILDNISESCQIRTLCNVNFSVTIGQIMPANVPKPLDMPIKMLAYRGAMSKWLTLKPEMANPENPTAKIRQRTANALLAVLAMISKNSASMPNPPQLKILRVWVVVNFCDRRKLSAKWPPIGTIMVIIKCGNAPKKPDWAVRMDETGSSRRSELRCGSSESRTSANSKKWEKNWLVLIWKVNF